jgi:hypothetical protein
MKNIHVLPTDKPSRLGYLTKKGKEVFKDLRLFDKPMPNILDSENQHLYITSDENIKEGDWAYCPVLKKPVFICLESILMLKNLGTGSNGNPEYKKEWLKKIILTTDSKLIDSGVQAISDEFLEWFVKNPGCEFVEWSSEKIEGSFDGEYWKYKYGTVIPQEEPKYIEDEFEMQSRIINKVWDEEESKQNLRDKLELLVEEWKKRQIYYEDIAQDNTAREHTYKKFTYKAMATRDCWKELLILLNESKNE